MAAKNTVDKQWNSPNYTSNAQVPSVFGRKRSIDYITIHWWGDPKNNPSYKDVISWLCLARSQVSAHDVITGTGRKVAVLVNYDDAAWHTNNATGNATSLGFECDPRCRPEDYEAVAQDIADTWKYYGRMIPLRAHSSWTATACPGNYDIAKLNKMALAMHNKKNTSKPATASEVKAAYLSILERKADANGLKKYTSNGMTIAQVRASLMSSTEKERLDAKKAAEASKKEWIKNLSPYTPGDSDYSKTTKLSVSPAAGVYVTNLETGSKLDDIIVPRGTNIDVVAKTKVKGVTYLISSYSKDKGLANGIAASALIKASPQSEDKPEWLKNLNDIEDKYFWTRSETPVLNLSDGKVSRNLPINTKVLVTHATQIVGKNLLVLEGQNECIETVYLSDKEIKNQEDDLSKRVANLETILESISKFLNDIFGKLKK